MTLGNAATAKVRFLVWCLLPASPIGAVLV